MALPPLETLMPVGRLYAAIPSPRKDRARPHRNMVTRHIKRGILGPDGIRHTLRAWKFAGTWYTTLEHFEDFIARTTFAPGEPADHPRSYSQRMRSSEAADRELRRMGA